MRGDKGFTLVELLVTVTIIGVLAAVVTVGVGGSASNAQTKANQGNFGDFQSAIDAWLASNPSLTASSVPTNTTFNCTGDGTAAGQCDDTTTPTTFQWYTAGGTTGAAQTLKAFLAGSYASGQTYQSINPAASTGTPAFTTFFRLNASTTVCVVDTTSSSGALKGTLVACHN